MSTLEVAPEGLSPAGWRRAGTVAHQLPLSDPGYVLLLRAVAGARLAGLVLAAPAVLTSAGTSAPTTTSLVLLATSSLAL
ncbi:MAG: hypothetical protein ACRYG2_04270, partial [Janthinobacterium lividum]